MKLPKSAAGRQDGNYEVPVLTEPKGGSVPKWTGGRKVSAAAEDDEANRVQRDYEDALAALLAAWPALVAPLVADLAAQAAAATTAGLVTLAASAATVAQIEAALSEAMLNLADKAAAQVVASAQAQGVTVEQPPPDDSRIVEVAAVTAALIGSAYTSAAVRRAMLAPAGTVATAVRTALDDMSQAQRGTVADNLGAALSAAQGQGRLAVLATAPAVAYVGVEDAEPSSNRCAACAAADGRRYESLADALRDRPTLMQLASCEGGPRCRGYLRPVWQ